MSTASAASPITDWAEAFAPPPALTVSEWADAHRHLPEASAAKGARWSNATAPYLVGIMDTTLEPGVQTLGVMKASQTGVSECVNNAIGYFIEHRPSPMLLVHPTTGAAEAFSKERLGDMIGSTPALRRRVSDKRLPSADERPESTLTLKMFPGGFLALGGANSPNTFARWAVRLAIGDDVDRFPAVVGREGNIEGDPADLLRNRTLSFHDGLTIFVSTPTVKGGRIDSLFARSDQRRWVVACSACGHAAWVTWSDRDHWWVRWDQEDANTARLQCPHCEASIPESARAAWVASGRWHPTAMPADPGAVGFHLPAMLSPFVTLNALVARWREAQSRGREALRTFVNTALAEPWEEEDRTIRLEPEGGFMSQRESYECIPNTGTVVDALFDVQDDRFEGLFVASGRRGEMWVIHHEVFHRDDGFDPYDWKAWEKLYVAITNARFDHASGVKLPIHTVLIDSGFHTTNAYRFTRMSRFNIFATKGVKELQDGHLIKWSEDRESATRRGVPLLLVATDLCKQRIADRVRDGRIHFPIADWCSEEFFAQLTAEACEPVFNPAGVRVGQKWVKQRPRNEILDLLVLAIAARACRGTMDLDAYRATVGLPPLTEDT
jgi:phage terminase large subunit GpA-like protein